MSGKKQDLKMKVYLVEDVSKAGNNYRYISIEKGEDFQKRVFLEPNETNLLTLLLKIDRQNELEKENFLDD